MATLGYSYEIQRIIPRQYLLCVVGNDIINILTVPKFLQVKEYELEPGTENAVLLSNDPDNPVLIYADKNNVGYIVLVLFKFIITRKDADAVADGKLEEECILRISAHKNKIRTMALNHNGKQVATCSHQGTLIRIFDTKTGHKLQEVRRGASPTNILDMCFSPEGNYLAVIGAQGTLHIYSIILMVEFYLKTKKAVLPYFLIFYQPISAPSGVSPKSKLTNHGLHPASMWLLARKKPVSS